MSLKRKTTAHLITALTTLFLLPLSACDSEEQKAQNAAWEQQASINAQAYIQEKYGIKADVMDASVDRIYGMFGSTPISDVYVDMYHENREFVVYITGEGSSTAGIDSYQAAEIEQALFDMLEANVPGLKRLSLQNRSKSKRDSDILLYDIYFNGSNLQEVVQDGMSSFIAFYLQTDFSDTAAFSFLEDYFDTDETFSCRFVSCRSQEALQQSDYAAQSPVYCDNERFLSYSTNEYQAYKLETYDHFLYCITSQTDETLHIKQVPAPDPTQFAGRGALPECSVDSLAYCISADEALSVVVYYPLSEIWHFDYDGYGNHNTRAAYIITSDGSERCAARPVDVLGDYVVRNFDIEPDTTTTFLFLADSD